MSTPWLKQDGNLSLREVKGLLHGDELTLDVAKKILQSAVSEIDRRLVKQGERSAQISQMHDDIADLIKENKELREKNG